MSSGDFFQALSEGKIDLTTADGQLKFGRGMVDWAIANGESPEYQAAIGSF